MKKVIWRGSSRSRIKDFPTESQDIAGHEILKIQFGKLPADWRPMPSIGPGAIEMRIHFPYEHRVIYVASYPEAIYILHCFEKKVQRTAIKDVH